MMKPADIPQDVWDTAFGHSAGGVGKARHNVEPVEPQEIIARAIMAEREACAVRAEALDRTGREWVADSLWANIKADTAADIRRGGP